MQIPSRTRTTIASASVLAFALVGCNDDGAVEETEDTVDETVDETEDTADETVDETEDELDDEDEATS